MKFYIYTLGCKVNTYESNVMKDKLLNNGYIEGNINDSDIYIINTCTVTNTSDDVAGNNSGETIYFAVLLDTTAVVKLPSDAEVKATLYKGDVATLNGTKVKDAQTIALLDAEPIVLSNAESLAYGEDASYYVLVEYVNNTSAPQEQGLSFTVEAEIVGIAKNASNNWVDENGKTIISAN